MKYFTKSIDKYFACWILPDTWHTGHPSDMDRFYRFVIAIDHFSKPLKRPPLDLNDPYLTKYPAKLRPKFAKLCTGTDRNPRTYDEKALKQKILLAVKRNYPDFNETYAAELVDEYVEKAMTILRALWAVKRIGFPDRYIKQWEPPLK